jgi:hypothetical protein
MINSGSRHRVLVKQPLPFGDGNNDGGWKGSAHASHYLGRHVKELCEPRLLTTRLVYRILPKGTALCQHSLASQVRLCVFRNIFAAIVRVYMHAYFDTGIYIEQHTNSHTNAHMQTHRHTHTHTRTLNAIGVNFL